MTDDESVIVKWLRTWVARVSDYGWIAREVEDAILRVLSENAKLRKEVKEWRLYYKGAL